MTTILYVSPSINVRGGISTVIKSYLKSDIGRSFNILLVASHVDGAKTHKLVQASFGLLKLLFYLVTKDVHIVHIHGGDIVSLKRKYFYYLIVKRFNTKVLYHFHGALFLQQYQETSAFWKRRIREMLEGCNIVITLSRSWQKALSEIAPRSTTILLPNAVYLPPRKRVHRPSNNTLHLTFLGHIGDRKGVFDLLPIAKRLLQEGYKLMLHVAGNGDVSRLTGVVRRLGISESVQYHGWLTERERNLLLDNTDIFILPSYGEGMPLAILEAMSYGLPVISTVVGGIPEMIINGETGILINPGDLEQLYLSLLELLSDSKKRIGWARGARLVVETQHDILKNIDRLRQIYQGMVA